LAALDNHLFKLLAPQDRSRLREVCEPVQLILSEVLTEPDRPTPYVYLPIDSFVSLLTVTDEGLALEVGMIGREGLVGLHLVLGVRTSPQRALVQGAGKAWRIRAPAFLRELARSPPLRKVMNRYLYVSMRQLATSAGCLRFHRIGPRLARWLLMTHDRAGADTFQVTQEVLAYMLGVRREGITSSASALQRAGLIQYRRGSLTVLDRAGLEQAACGCYAADCAAYAARP
jgi:CRP-like cAMP-binding protein